MHWATATGAQHAIRRKTHTNVADWWSRSYYIAIFIFVLRLPTCGGLVVILTYFKTFEDIKHFKLLVSWWSNWYTQQAYTKFKSLVFRLLCILLSFDTYMQVLAPPKIQEIVTLCPIRGLTVSKAKCPSKCICFVALVTYMILIFLLI